MLTLTEVQEKLKLIDEISLMEILEITSEDLVHRFIDRIEIKYDQLLEDLQEEQEEMYFTEGDEWLEYDLNDEE